MQVETARTLAGLLQRHASEQNNFLFYAKDVEPDVEYERIKLMIGHTMAALYSEALYWIYEEHADLTPPELR